MSIFDPNSVRMVVTYVLPAAILGAGVLAYYFGFGALLDASKRVGRK